MPRKALAKCYRCAALHIDQVHQIHGSPNTDPEHFVRDPNILSDGCYDLKKCPPRRSRLRNSEVNSHKQAVAQQVRQHLQIDDAQYTALKYAVLIVYREARSDAPIHAIGGTLWDGLEQIAEITPIHTEGMTPAVLEAYIERTLSVLRHRYGIRSFSARIRRDPLCCPIRPCFHHSEVGSVA